MITGNNGIKEVMDALSNLSLQATLEIFVSIFGEPLGHHFWSRFKQHDSDIIALYLTMDEENAAKLIEYISKTY